MTGNTNTIAPSKLRKPVVPVLLTLLAGLGGGIFAMKSDAGPSEPQADDSTAPANSARTAIAAIPVAMVEPNFAPKAALAEAAPIVARLADHSAPTIPSARLARSEADFADKSDPVAAAPPVAARPAMELTPAAQPAVSAALSATAIATAIAPAVAAPLAIVEVPVALAVNDAPGAMPAASTPASPAAMLADTVAVVAERPAETPAPNAAAAPVAASESAPVPQLALADWNYSLPEQAPASDRDAFAAASSNAPITLVPSHAAPGHETQGRETQSTAARSTGARAQLATPSGKVATAIGSRKIAGSGFASSINSRSKYQFVGSEIEFQLPVVANGAPVGDLTLHVAPNQQVSLRLSELLSLFHDQIDPQVFTALVASPNIESFVTFEKLRDAGIEIRYDAARDRLALSVEQP